MSYTDPVTVTGLTAEDAVTRLKFCMQDDGAGGIQLKVSDGGAISGPGTPSVDSYDSAVVDVASGATGELVATPGANKQIWVYGFFGTTDTADATVVLKSAATAKTGTIPIADNGGFSLAPSGNFSQPWLKCASNEALNLTTAGGTFDGMVAYAVVDVS